MPASTPRYRIGIDVGGTFTDFFLACEDGQTRALKVPSTPDDPTIAVMQGLGEMAAAAGHASSAFLQLIDRIVHGTTVTTNAVLTGRMASVGLLTTRGFRDALQMRRGIREEPYDNKYTAPDPIVPRWLRLPVGGRIDWAGNEIEPLALEDVDKGADVLRAAGVEAVAICFMHAHANGAHERRAAERLRELLPKVYLSVSSEILPQVRFYERLSTTALNAAVGPIMEGYLDHLSEQLRTGGFRGILLIMQSNGGVCSPDVAASRAAHTLLSGPAAAPIACLSRDELHDGRGFIAVDMGGTSFDASLTLGKAPAVTTSAAINRYATALPSLDIKTIGAGGGSIAWIDDGALLHMGPRSAGAIPGPACYGHGGRDPTCTDANLLLGYLSGDRFAAGRFPLDSERAREAIQRHIAGPLGLGLIEAAAGMYRIMNVTMASALREISVERGHDPRDYPMICAGGAGGVHAAMIARELGMTRIAVPRDGSVFCASGMLYSDLRYDLVKSCASRPDALYELDALFAELEEEGRLLLESQGIPGHSRGFRCALDLRYSGQYQEVLVEDIPGPVIGNVEALSRLFHRTHDRLYGYCLETATIEVINARLTAIGFTDKPGLIDERKEGRDPGHGLLGTRPVYAPDSAEFVETPVYGGELLRYGNGTVGPAIIESDTMSILVPEGFDVAVGPAGTVILTDKAIPA